jgi:Ca-activated chloride channel family protein
VGVTNEFSSRVDPLRYRNQNEQLAPFDRNNSELMTIKFRYKQPDGNVSKLIEHQVSDKATLLSKTSVDFRFAAAVAEFGLLLRDSEFKQSSSYENVRQLAGEALGKDDEGYRNELLQLIRLAQSLAAK